MVPALGAGGFSLVAPRLAGAHAAAGLPARLRLARAVRRGGRGDVA